MYVNIYISCWRSTWTDLMRMPSWPFPLWLVTSFVYHLLVSVLDQVKKGHQREFFFNRILSPLTLVSELLYAFYLDALPNYLRNFPLESRLLPGTASVLPSCNGRRVCFVDNFQNQRRSVVKYLLYTINAMWLRMEIRLYRSFSQCGSSHMFCY